MGKTPWNSTNISLTIIVLVLIGILLGIIFQINSPVEIDPKIRYSELLNWISTLTIGVLVGYVLKNQFENDKTIKSYLLDDLKKITEDVVILKYFCYSFKKNQSFTSDQRDEINAKINILDKKITVFCDFLNHCYNGKHKNINDSLVTYFIKLNNQITGDGFYDNLIQNSYFDNIMNESSKFETELRKLTHKIIKKI